MSQFEGFNTENKLRIRLSDYTAQIIETDCINFFKKKTTLINTVILNYYQQAECTISLRLADYKAELLDSLSPNERKQGEKFVNSIIQKKAASLKEKYAHRYPYNINWQVTLNKKVKTLLTSDPRSSEEKYYGDRPGHYVTALLEEYALLPYYQREEIIFKDIINVIEDAIDGKHALTLTNAKKIFLSIKPYKITSDPLNMYHYVIGYNIEQEIPESSISSSPKYSATKVLSLRLSRLTNVEKLYFPSGKLSESEKSQILDELKYKGVQFASFDLSSIRIWLSDDGIKRYNSQIHLRPSGERDPQDEHIFIFNCTEEQILYYFIGFGKDARIISPESLSLSFKDFYEKAIISYK